MMEFISTDFDDAWLIKPKPVSDDRGCFTRLWCRHKFKQQGLESNLQQINLSVNHQRGTLRGMHFQSAPYEEVKIVRCCRGSIFDVIVDIRPDSSTFGHWQGFRLSDENLMMLYVPRGFAHGFLTLADGAEVFYQMSNRYESQSARGLNYADPDVKIRWPIPISVVSSKDQKLPFLKSMPD